jgi:hypothetical protein
MDSVGELTELLDRPAKLVDRGPQQVVDVSRRLGTQPPLPGAKLERKRDQSLLRAVVEIALDPPALLVTGGNDPGPRLLEEDELGAKLRLQAGVLERQLRRGGSITDERRFVLEGRVVRTSAAIGSPSPPLIPVIARLGSSTGNS